MGAEQVWRITSLFSHPPSHAAWTGCMRGITAAYFSPVFTPTRSLSRFLVSLSQGNNGAVLVFFNLLLWQTCFTPLLRATKLAPKGTWSVKPDPIQPQRCWIVWEEAQGARQSRREGCTLVAEIQAGRQVVSLCGALWPWDTVSINHAK